MNSRIVTIILYLLLVILLINVYNTIENKVVFFLLTVGIVGINVYAFLKFKKKGTPTTFREVKVEFMLYAFLVAIVVFLHFATENKTDTIEIAQGETEIIKDTLEEKIEYLRNNPDYTTLLNSGMYNIDSIIGDFDGNGTLEYLYLFFPKDEFLCMESSIPYNIFLFSDASIKPLANIDGDVHVILENLGDIYFDGRDAIFMWCGSHFTSCWSGADIYTLTDTGWTEALEKGGFSIYRCDMDEEYGKHYPFVKADKRKKGFVQITYMDFYDEDIDMYDFGSDAYETYRWKIKQKWVPLKKVKM